MKLVLKASGSSDVPATSEYAFVDLTHTLAQTLLTRRAQFHRVRDDALYRITYWGGIAWFGSMGKSTFAGEYPATWDMDEFSDPSEAFLRQYLSAGQFAALQVGHGPMEVPAACQIPAVLTDSTECDMLDVTAEGVLYKCYPRHCTYLQEADRIPWALIEAAAGRPAIPSAPAMPTPA